MVMIVATLEMTSQEGFLLLRMKIAGKKKSDVAIIKMIWSHKAALIMGSESGWIKLVLFCGWQPIFDSLFKY